VHFFKLLILNTHTPTLWHLRTVECSWRRINMQKFFFFISGSCQAALTSSFVIGCISDSLVVLKLCKRIWHNFHCDGFVFCIARVLRSPLWNLNNKKLSYSQLFCQFYCEMKIVKTNLCFGLFSIGEMGLPNANFNAILCWPLS
jgi:hypothetical protein